MGTRWRWPPIRELRADALLAGDARHPDIAALAGAIDYAFRRVLHSMGAEHVIQGYFLLDRLIEVTEDGVILAPDAESALLSIVDFHSAVLSRGDRLWRLPERFPAAMDGPG